ncbi:MAG: PaaI family thioesterase [Paracoccaceae bacterium]
MIAETESQRLQRVANDQPAFAKHLGIRLVSFGMEKVVAELDSTEELSNRNGVMHGGAVMGFADNVGGTLASLYLGPGQMTTTVESKTNFLRSIPKGQTATATATPLHAGRRTVVVETRITRTDGKLAAIVTQTQMLMRRERD